MARPTIADIDRTTAGWVTAFNDNFAKLLDGPFPIAFYTDAAALTAARNPKLYKDCFAIASGKLHKSDGTSWLVFRKPIAYIADLDGGTASVTDIKNAFNGILSTMKTNGWMES